MITIVSTITVHAHYTTTPIFEGDIYTFEYMFPKEQIIQLLNNRHPIGWITPATKQFIRNTIDELQ